VVLHRSWVVYQGDLDQELEPAEFYAKVGHPELGESYASRRTHMFGGFVVSGAALVIGSALMWSNIQNQKDCSITLDENTYSMCLDSRGHDDDNLLITLSVTAGVSLIGTLVGLWYYQHPHPISENDAKALADAYNQRLRRELGPPVVTSKPLLHDVKLMPFVARGDAGLMLGARF
jgi:hypothetical protein